MCGDPPSLVPLEALISSTVRVSSRLSRDEASEESVSCRASVWSGEEKALCMDAARLWAEGVPPSSVRECGLPFPLNGGDVSDSSGQGAKEEFPSLDGAFVEKVVRGTLWKACSGGNNYNENNTRMSREMTDMDRLRVAVRGLCRHLRQRHDGDERRNESNVEPNALRGVRQQTEEEEEEEEARRIIAVVAGATGIRSMHAGVRSSREPFLVGLVCRETHGEAASGGATVRTVVASELIQSFNGHECFAGNDVGEEEKGWSTWSVMLLEAGIPGEESFPGTSKSPMWRTLLSVVDFVYAVGRPVFVSRMASHIKKVYCTPTLPVALPSSSPTKVGIGTVPEVKHLRLGCAARPAVCPSFYYTVVGEGPVTVEKYTGKADHVRSLPNLLCELMQQQPRRTEEEGLWGSSSCSRDALQWLLLLGHVWCSSRGDSDAALPSAIRHGVRPAVDLFLAVAEGLLLAMRAMEPLPPLLLRGSSISTVKAIPRLFTVEDALRTAHRVALFAYRESVAPYVFNGPFTPRHFSLQDIYCGCHYQLALWELNETCQLVSEALKERLKHFANNCATQVLREFVVPATGAVGANGVDKNPEGNTFLRTILDCTDKLKQFCSASLIPHYGMAGNADNNTAAAEGRSDRHHYQLQRCQMMESPIVSPWAPAAKAFAISEYLQQSVFPALQRLAQEHVLAARASLAKESETREAVFAMEDHCAQLQQRWSQAEAQLEHQRATVREAKRRSDVLNTHLQEACKCLQKLVMTCVGYEEVYNSYTRKLGFRVKHSCAATDIAPTHNSTGECPHESEKKGDTDALVTTPPKVSVSGLSAKKNRGVSGPLDDVDDVLPQQFPLTSSSSTLSPSSSGQMQLMSMMLRDAQQQLEACHNVLLCLYEDAHEALRKLSTTTVECTSASLNDSRQSMLSVSLRAARSVSSNTRGGHSANVSINDVLPGEASTMTATERVAEVVVNGCATGPDMVHHQNTTRRTLYHEANGVDGEREFTAVGASSSSSPQELSGLTRAPHDTTTPLRRQRHQQQQQQLCLETSQQKQRQLSSWCATTASPMPTPDRNGTAAVEAIADLQRQRQDALEALAQLQGRCNALEAQMKDQRAALRDTQRTYAADEQKWRAERQALQERLDAAKHDVQMAHEQSVQSQEEAERWALSLAGIMATAEAEAQRVVSESASEHSVNGDCDGVGGSSNVIEYDAQRFRVEDPHEALRVGRMQLASLVARVAAAAHGRGANVAETHAARQEAEVRQLLQQEIAALHEKSAVLRRELDCTREQMREAETTQQQARIVATAQSAEEAAQLSAKVNRVEEALVAARGQVQTLQLKCDRLVLQQKEALRRLHCVEAVHLASFSVWNDAMMARCELLQQEWSVVAVSFCTELCRLRSELQQSQEEARRWEETVHQQAHATQKTVEEVAGMARRIEQYREAQSSADLHTAQLLHRLSQLSAAYVNSFDAWECAMDQRCKLLLQQWSVGPQQHCNNDPALPLDEASMRPGLVEVYDPCGLRHELHQKRRRVAELEEALRQKKVACATLTETVAQLHALLHLQRELGMPIPPPPPLISREFGVLSAAPKGAGDVAALTSAFYTSPNRLEGKATGKNHQQAEPTVISAPSEGGYHAVTPNSDNSIVRNGDHSQMLATVDDNSGEGKRNPTEPRSLGWYLQSLSAIESALTP
ncbi:hypothetical protein DQ04_04281010 [Trypanosoma grayi]|uniref:hypothetical protein n=1 Tax=Trypanosoma grayi TaxID=71804 RepID=UPI0004F3F9BF|nr:hypothetical protein DQ04_04281010 [Trypanosoma grayi]KEG10025.1 hypothetical protein DQ04_04281010 [Trypanosoma grayi]